jgi:protein-S-isoprenylcysteine O-methyltransferase Ste14
MQAGALLLILFGNSNYTVESVIWICVHFSFVLTGVIMEEKRLCVLEKNYPEYMRQVKYRFIPYVI